MNMDQSSLPAARGKLKIFLGMCAGVGKTYAMLREARQKLSEGVSVIVGFAETHKRPETETLLKGMVRIPLKKIDYRGVVIEEMDLDAILEKRPSLAVVDELAHSNAPGSRHTKRYQAVLELLDAGIDVFTALNVQHIESRADVVRGITSITVRETVPDSIIDSADDIQLIDITPENLRVRLSEGKVYFGDRAAVAADNFFRMENLSALREIALRIMAEKIGRDVRDAMAQRHIQGPWKSSEQYMVAVGASPYSEPLIRWTRRIAAAMQSPWMAVHVEGALPLTDAEKQRLSRNLSLARQLGGETLTITHDDVATALISVAVEKNVTQIVIGKPRESLLVRLFTGRSLVDKLLLKSGDIDVCVVRAEKSTRKSEYHSSAVPSSVSFLKELLFGFGFIAAITPLFWLLRTLISYSSIALFYLLGIVFLSTKISRRAVVTISVITGIIWDFLFIPPVYTLTITSLSDILMLCAYLAVAIVVGSLTARLRLREMSERLRERRTRVLYQLAQCAVESRDLDEGIRLAVGNIDSVFDCKTAVTLAKTPEAIAESPHAASTMSTDQSERGVIGWVFNSGKCAGRFTDTLPRSKGIHLPLSTAHGSVGVLSLLFPESMTLDVGGRELLETVADQVAALIDRYNLIRQANESLVMQESEKVFHILFDSVSHELKTPLAILTSAIGQITETVRKGDDANATVACNESAVALGRLRRAVNNLLEMTRMEAGHADRETSLCDLDEIVHAARGQAADLLQWRTLNVSIPDDMPPIQADPLLLTHAVANLLANAAQYSPAESAITVLAVRDEDRAVLRIIDEGEGIPEDEPSGKLFEKFYRGRNAKPGGTGLGLSIVYRFMELMGGRVTAENNSSGKGATITLTFPLKPIPGSPRS